MPLSKRCLRSARSRRRQGAGQAKEYTQRDSRSPGELKKAANIIKQVHLSSTQGPGIKLDLRDVLA